MTAALVAVAMAFAFSIGAHYTGACMGMPYALGAVSARRALLIMAPLALLGAAVASHAVEHTVAHGLLTGRGLSLPGLVLVEAVAFAATSAFNRLRVPTSTIQILVFTVVGAGLAAGTGVRWSTIGRLALVWLTAPPAAAAAGYLLTRALGRGPAGGRGRRSAGPPTAASPGAGAADRHQGPRRSGTVLGGALVAVGALASFAMGGNDVANATGALVGSHTLDPLGAGAVGGVALAAGVVTWGGPLLRRVAFEIVTVDRAMATAAQLVQAGVVLAAVAFGLFTSMNQALVGALAGTGAARGRHTVHAATLRAIARGWLVGPAAGAALAYLAGRAAAAATGQPHLLVG